MSAIMCILLPGSTGRPRVRQTRALQHVRYWSLPNPGIAANLVYHRYIAAFLYSSIFVLELGMQWTARYGIPTV